MALIIVLIMVSEMVMAAPPGGEWVFVTEYDEHDPALQVETHVKLYIDPTSVIGGTETSIGKRIFFSALKTYEVPDLLGTVRERISCEAALGEKWLLHFLEVRFYDAQDREVGTPVTDFGPWIQVNPHAPEPNYYKLTAAAKKALGLNEESACSRRKPPYSITWTKTISRSRT
jgi:hypothetical protein